MILKLGTTSQEVARWQSFIGVPPTGIFNAQTKDATIAWQINHRLTGDGAVGPDTFAKAATLGYKAPQAGYFPPRPSFSSPTVAECERMFGKFSWRKRNSSDITITDNWAAKNLVKVHLPQLRGINGFPADGYVVFHSKGAAQLKAFFDEVEVKGLTNRIISWAGSFYPRLKRGSSSSLSNHSWGTAFDINAPENWLAQEPASLGEKGCLLELVPIANKHGFYWGGHYSGRKDGMHFELARIQVNPFAGLLTREESAVTPAVVPSPMAATPEPAVGTLQPGPAMAGGDLQVGQPPVNQAEIVQSETLNEDGSKTVDTSLKAPAEDAPGILDHVNSLGDRFQGLQGTLDKFGISNPLAHSSLGTYLMAFGKFIFGVVMAGLGVAYNHPEYLIVTLVVVGLAAWIYNQSRTRVAVEKAGVPVGLLEKVIDKK